jgi:hypothetical protein
MPIRGASHMLRLRRTSSRAGKVNLIRVRIFLLDPGGATKPCSAARFDRLWKGDLRERLPAHKGSIAQFAHVVVLLVDGLPRRVVRIDYLRIRVTADGLLDQDEKERLLSLAVRAINLPIPWLGIDGVIQADQRFAQEATRQFLWVPTARQRATMVRLALRRRNRQ